MGPVKIVFFDALYTLLQPRRPIFEQARPLPLPIIPRSTSVTYARVLAPYVGSLQEIALKSSFKIALAELQKERPAYRSGKTADQHPAVTAWWREVVRRTAVGAGADPRKLDDHLDAAVNELLHVFSSRQGYKLADGALETLSTLHELGVRTGLVSNSDSRILDALQDLEAIHLLHPAVVSDLEGIEKPDSRMWEIACRRAGVAVSEAAHVGDEYEADVLGAHRAGLRPIWFCPPGQDTHVDVDPDRVVPSDVPIVEKFPDVVQIVKQWNQAHSN